MEYPEHEKLHAKETESRIISEFLDFLSEQGIQLGKPHKHTGACMDDNLQRIRCGIPAGELWQGHVPNHEQLIGLFLDIDPKKLSDEKEAMYQTLRKASRVKTRRETHSAHLRP